MTDEKLSAEEPAKLVFEEALTELEAIVAKMESGQLKLDECIAQFERGSKLAGWCSEKLMETEKKIEVLVSESGGEPQWQGLDNAR